MEDENLILLSRPDLPADRQQASSTSSTSPVDRTSFLVSPPHDLAADGKWASWKRRGENVRHELSALQWQHHAG
jgi:hypothetical protein